MNCDDVRQHWNLFYDSEGDAELHHRINEHLAMCPACSRWCFEQSRLEDALIDKLRAGSPTPAMWDRIGAACGEKQPAAARSRLFTLGAFWMAALVLAAAAGLAWFGFNGVPGMGESPDLTSLSVSWHENLASGREALKLASSSPQEVEDYVRTRVNFPMRCPPREDAGFVVAGGGVCSFQRDAVAYVVGDVDGRRVSVFIMDRNSVANYPAHDAALRREGLVAERRGGFDVVMGELDRNLILVVGRLDPGRLTRVLKAYGSYPNHDAGASAPVGPGADAHAVERRSSSS